MTSHLNQGSIKNYFCRIWVIGGSNLHPASTDQKTHYQKSIRSCCRNSITASASFKIDFLMTSHLNEDNIKVISAEFGLLEAATPILDEQTKKLIVVRTSLSKQHHSISISIIQD
jgi:hypothetical protein